MKKRIKLIGIIAIMAILALSMTACDNDNHLCTDHSWSSWTTKTEPTCTTPLVEKRTCSICDHEDTRNVGEPLGHDESGAAATCTTAKICVRPSCTHEIAAALGHSWGEWTITTAPACTTAGIGTRACTVCSSTDPNTVVPATHTWGEWAIVTAPTCTTTGIGIRVCTVCNITDTNTVVPATHTWGEWAIATVPTCIATGVGIRLCIACNETDPNTVIPLAAHSWSGWTTKTEATCITAKVERRTCSLCEYEETQNAGKPFGHLGHNFSNGFCTQSLCFMIEMMPIPATGNFVSDGHTITLSAFRMGKFQVTQELYEAVMGHNPSWFQGTESYKVVDGEVQGKRPVEQVSWYDAIVFCNRLSIREGLIPAYEMQTVVDTSVWSSNPDTWGTVPTSTNSRWNAVRIVPGSTGFRLPTEAQWEYACRAGSDPTWTWYFGNNENLLINHAWYSENSNNRTHQVGLKTANLFGLHDMHGNVWEWCWDWWNSGVSFPNPADLNDPFGATSGSDRVRRGAAWGGSASGLRSARRLDGWPGGRVSDLGFRVVRP